MPLGFQTQSKFIRRLNQVMAGAVPGIGFRAQKAETVPALLLVVTLPDLDPDLAEAAVKGGASALQVRMNLQDESGDATALQSLFKAAGDCPCGILLAGTSGASVKRIESWRSAGIDFVVLGADSDPACLGIHDVGRVLTIDHTFDSELTRTINELPFDAIEASLASPDEVGKPLSVRDLMRYRSLSMTIRKPILVRADHRVLPDTVAALRDARVEGLCIDATETGSDKDSILEATTKFARAIEALGAARGRSAPTLHPTIPMFPGGRETTGVPEEEPEDE